VPSQREGERRAKLSGRGERGGLGGRKGEGVEDRGDWCEPGDGRRHAKAHPDQGGTDEQAEAEPHPVVEVGVGVVSIWEEHGQGGGEGWVRWA
jgi:hypothetical protein